MSIEPGAVLLMQWLSPAYPVGAFAYSHGLEAACAAGQVTDGRTLSDWLGDLLLYGAGRTDPILLACAYRAGDEATVAQVDARSRAFAPSRERLAETVNQGRAFCQTTAGVWGHDLPDLTYPVAVGRAARLHGLSLDLTLQMYVHAFVSNLVAAAQRLLPVGQLEGQRVLTDLAPLIREAAQNALDRDLTALAGASFASDIASMHHETQYSRIFRS
ncbi:urease accessory protein UreF [Phaeobacter sp. QD34_3]|uniref:urease accessory protein UreF n=1 Tax=unclassified Phaeobacter TaxID=2621772 RepID=UPI00237F9773|nr:MULTISPECIES: urease accessory protein UreF [unclassified Phaeobacter]MDE4133161.1 urease accessory protein UreF [Phaeobacter sp. QD34_3]MDE4136769.1 urease accessory protein UreF [Phaeobacter sp. QD34_24]MDE4173076.1 urease accessory protein UreF [Phaeobacter sp. PT47_59]